MEKRKLEAGQTLYYSAAMRDGKRSEPFTLNVTKVGRDYVYTDNWRNEKISKDYIYTGTQREASVFTSLEDIALCNELREKHDYIKSTFEKWGANQRNFTLDQLRRITEIINE